MIASRYTYGDPEVDYEALVAKRNAPRWLAKLAEFAILEPRDAVTISQQTFR